MSGPGRSLGRHLVVLGGLLGIAASPAAGRLGAHIRRRLRGAGHGLDPVAPFRDAPCYPRTGRRAADDESRAQAPT